MLNKKYLPSIGFVILFITLLSSALFIKWALGPLSYEKAAYEEQRGHQLVKDDDFNPEKEGMNNDERDLGVRFIVEERGINIDE